jgi:CHAT domain-containing protein
MIRFHQLYRRNLSLSAAGALRDAVQWLRTATYEQLSTFASEWRLPPVSIANPIRDAVRGSEIPIFSEKELGEKNALFLSFDSVLATGEVLFPYNHPVYWASPIIYGV